MEVVSFFYFTKTSKMKSAVTTRYKKSIQDSARYIWPSSQFPVDLFEEILNAKLQFWCSALTGGEVFVIYSFK